MMTHHLYYSKKYGGLFGGEVAGVVFPFGDEGGHVGGQLAVEVHLLARLGMDEAEGLGMQRLPWTQLKAVIQG